MFVGVTTLEGYKCFYLSVFNIPLLPVSMSVCEIGCRCV